MYCILIDDLTLRSFDSIVNFDCKASPWNSEFALKNMCNMCAHSLRVHACPLLCLKYKLWMICTIFHYNQMTNSVWKAIKYNIHRNDLKNL